jgi:hypothetical protein
VEGKDRRERQQENEEVGREWMEEGSKKSRIRKERRGQAN